MLCCVKSYGVVVLCPFVSCCVISIGQSIYEDYQKIWPPRKKAGLTICGLWDTVFSKGYEGVYNFVTTTYAYIKLGRSRGGLIFRKFQNFVKKSFRGTISYCPGYHG